MKIERDAWIVLADGRKALIAQNVGTPLEPRLSIRRVLEAERNPPTHEQGTDRPGRSFDFASHRRSAVEQTDWHDQAEARFAKIVARELEKLCQSDGVDHLVLVAAPRALAHLRASMAASVKKKTVNEVDKDLTRHPVPEVEKILAAL